MATWTRYDAQKPPAVDRLYWWRAAAKNYGGLVLQPEWTDRYLEMSCGLQSEWWPMFARWDGYSRSVPAGLEWREAEPTDKKDAVLWPGLVLLPCPFCGAAPVVQSHRGDLFGSGIYIGARAFEHNNWKVECSGCSLASTFYSHDLAGLQSRWNRRAAVLVEAAP